MMTIHKGRIDGVVTVEIGDDTSRTADLWVTARIRMADTLSAPEATLGKAPLSDGDGNSSARQPRRWSGRMMRGSRL